MDWGPQQMRDGHPVIDLLKDRARGRKRKAKLGLVVEGGSMRGVVSAGEALAFELLDLRKHFDAFYGVSAGAVTAAYFAAEQATIGATVFYDDLLTKQFFSYRRVLRGKAPMDLDFVINEVVETRKPLDFSTALEQPLSIFGTCAEDGDLVCFPRADSKDDLKRQMRAAITMPLLGGGATEIDGRLYLDGGVHTGVPWEQALADGCTHLVVLLTRPADQRHPGLKRLEQFLVLNYLARRYPDLVPTFLQRVEAYNRGLDQLRALEAEGGPVLTIAPAPGEALVGGQERNREKILDGVKSGARASYQALFGRSPHFYELITPTSGGGHLVRPAAAEKAKRWRRRSGTGRY